MIALAHAAHGVPHVHGFGFAVLAALALAGAVNLFRQYRRPEVRP